MRVACLGQKPRAAEVDGEHVVPVLDGHVAYCARLSDPSIRYQCIKAAKFGYRSIDKLSWHVGIADIARQGDGSTSH